MIRFVCFDRKPCAKIIFCIFLCLVISEKKKVKGKLFFVNKKSMTYFKRLFSIKIGDYFFFLTYLSLLSNIRKLDSFIQN